MNRAERVSYPFLEVLAVLLAAAYEKVRDAVLAYGEERARAAAASQLQHLSDHMLRDIGLRRSQIEAVARGDYRP
jgi:uncharacterized protein YjiS (DUF1127 family)